MGLMRLLLWCGFGLLLYLGLRQLGRGSVSGPRPGAGRGGAEDMVRCRTCGLNLPKSEALPVDGGWACSAEHARERKADDHP